MTSVTTLGWSDVADEAFEVVRLAAERGLTVRLLGSAGIRLHCEESAGRMDELDRETKDVDVVVPRGDRGGVRSLLEERGYHSDRDVLVTTEGRRFLFRHPELGLELDVFVDRLEFCHTLDVRDRLARHPVTLPLEDLLLSKAQIVELTPNDLKDLLTLLCAHEVSEGGGEEPEAIDAPYVARLLARDWGFFHTVSRNLERLHAVLGDGGLAWRGADRAAVVERIRALLAAMERAEKSRRWRLRARVGERVQWFNDVDEREATY